jgi:hypothetical protein
MLSQTTIMITILSLVACGLIAMLAVFLRLQHGNAKLREEETMAKQETAQSLEALSQRLKMLEREVTSLRAEREEIGIFKGLPASLPGTGASINLSKRSQALRMLRRGESAERVTAVLGIPRREIELLLKVQQSLRVGVGTGA